MSDSNIMSIKEMIDIAFGEPDANKVDFKLIQTILYILARQLRILERQVKITFGPKYPVTTSTISITELQLQAKVPKRGKSSKASRKRVDDERKIYRDRVTDTSLSKLPAKQQPTREKKSPTTQGKTRSLSKISFDKNIQSFEKSWKAEDESKGISNEEREKKDFLQYIDELERLHEQELRVVHQRANSREEAEKSPTPMASLDSMEYMQYEKLLVVERTPKDKPIRKTDTPRLSIVTQEQFEELTKEVRELQQKFGIVGVADFPENIQLMKELRKGASLTDAMAALQLSARLEASEKTLEQLMSLITELASRTGIEVAWDEAPKKTSDKNLQREDTNVIFKKTDIKSLPTAETTQVTKKLDEKTLTSNRNIHEGTMQGTMNTENLYERSAQPPNWISARELDDALQALHNNIMKAVTSITNETSSNAQNALKMIAYLEKALTSALNLENRMHEIETEVSEYAEKVNLLDTGLSSQMTYYQEQLTQMQHDLESGIETMAEAIANATGNPDAVAELNANFNNLQTDIDFNNVKQKELEENENLLSMDLQALLQQIEILRATKADREEVTDALRDKAGLEALNGLVTQSHFQAVRGDIEKRIGAAYNKFDSQELQWQKAIDDLQRNLDVKVDVEVVQALRDSVNENLEKIRKRIQEITEIVGEPRAAAISKIIFRDSACISCSSPAHMNLTEPNAVPALPAFNKISDNETKTKPKEDGDHGVCYPGRPIPHPIDTSKSHMCQRYCGGTHTTASKARNKLPASVGTGPIIKTYKQDVGTDGKMYMTNGGEDLKEKKTPCICNTIASKPHMMAAEKEIVKADEITIESMNFTPQLNVYNASLLVSSVSVTPPYLFED